VTRVKGYVSKEGVDEIMTREVLTKEENLRGNQTGFDHNRGAVEAAILGYLFEKPSQQVSIASPKR